MGLKKAFRALKRKASAASSKLAPKKKKKSASDRAFADGSNSEQSRSLTPSSHQSGKAASVKKVEDKDAPHFISLSSSSEAKPDIDTELAVKQMDISCIRILQT
ncbi:hypothetical protein PHLGIDRAFT_119427 [Phlebiopsis gigantea 11061_1 CR5-6]|uniref:Uncharacterized protein n=1 Tax=Phlebiopsis gigantea (strain 11061_1 CR5-6) TaxID=745531 RepID=A0A0C3NLH7_PHLG1|nr:hypothetical protein PHLGIDRAFT_119427 [Phlebiopsis gigantea 11061_1 CR5-6]